MRFVTFEVDGEARPGAVDGDDIVDIGRALPGAPATMKEIIAGGRTLLDRIEASLEGAPAEARHALSGARLLLPVTDPGKIVCLGLNYADHAREGGHEVPDYPALFMRAATSLIAHNQPMIVPRCSEKLDYEAELMIVVGSRCRHVVEEDTLSVIFGYTLFNDGSVRDYQRKTTQWTPGKNFDGTGPVGPWIVTADELPPGASGLRIRSILNGRTLQDSNTEHMIFSVQRTIAILSEVMTLEPGDLIATGTPEGVGHPRKPPLWLKPGDTIEIDVEKIGTLSNPVKAG